MEKEVLTIRHIKKDLMQYLHQETLGIIIGFPCLWLIIAISNRAIKNRLPIGNTLFEAVTVILIFGAIVSIAYVGIMHLKIKRTAFTLKNDTLIEKTILSGEGQNGIATDHTACVLLVIILIFPLS